MTTPNQHRDVQRVFSLTLVLNLLVAFAKIALGLMTGALAITADGFHSLTDGAGNAAGLMALRVSNNPPDDDHPYGHGKFETIAALAIGLLLFLTAWEVFTSVLDRMGGSAPQVTTFSLLVLFATLLVNIAVSRYQRREAARLGSIILMADAQNTATDVWVTISVLVSSVLTALTGWGWIDFVTALVVVALIAKAAWGIVQQTGRVLVDTAPYTVEDILPVVEAISAVQSVARVRSRGTQDAAFIDVDVRVNPSMTVSETERVTQDIRERLSAKLHGIEEVEVHFST